MAGKNRKSNRRAAAEEEAPKKRETLRDNVSAVLVAVLFALFVRTFAVQAFQIPTASMEDGLLVGDHLLVNKSVFSIEPGLDPPFLPRREIRRFDVIVFKFPNDPSQDFIKRVIGLPGETLRVVDDVVYIDNRALPETRAIAVDPFDPSKGLRIEPAEGAGPYTVYLKHGRGGGGARPSGAPTNFGPVGIPPGHYFAMGDNRDNSQDSRSWGPVPREYIKGRGLLIYWSYEAERDSHVWRGVGHLLWQWGDRIVNFPRKTRWSRTGDLVR